MHQIAEKMLFNRLAQIIVNEKYKKGAFKVPIHLALGHEAIAVAISEVKRPGDFLILNHRNIQHNLNYVKSLKPVLDEYLLLQSGLGMGHLGSMNLANPEQGLIYTSNILGSSLCVGTGIALSQSLKKNQALTFIDVGDGAIEEGSFYESLVFLKSNHLSAMIVVEDNGWSLATKIDERRCEIDLGSFAAAVGCKFFLLEGNNITHYVNTLAKAGRDCLMDQGPVLVHAKLSSLGDWVMKNDQYPQGKYINYHAGPSPTINWKTSLIIQESDQDPIFVLKKQLGEPFEQLSEKIATELTAYL